MSMTNKVRVKERYEVTPDVVTMRSSAYALVEQLLSMTQLEPIHHREMLSIAMWKVTEAAGNIPNRKYNVRYCSDGVVNAAEPTKVNHEHVHPRKWMVDELLSERVNAGNRKEFLDKYGVACIVTVAEHGRLSASNKKGWERYLDADVRVFDRAVGDYVGAEQPAGTELPPQADESDANLVSVSTMPVHEAIDKFARPGLAPLLHRLNRMVRLGLGTSALHNGKGEPEWFRVYDALVEEPTRAVAFVKWNGDVDLALTPAEVPDQWRRPPYVKNRAAGRSPHLVRVTVRNEQSAEIAEELLAIAMDKIRQEYWG
jgi:hypothetical protein